MNNKKSNLDYFKEKLIKPFSFGQFFRFSKGFTFIEILIVVAIVTILAVAAIIIINPAKRFADAQDAQRQIHLQSILNAIETRMSVERGWFEPCDPLPHDIDENSFPIFKTIGTKDDPAFYDLYKCLVPDYLSTPLFDPAAGSVEDTKYQIWQNPYNKNVSVIYKKDEKELVVGPEKYWEFSVPTLTTTEVTDVATSSARSGATILDEGDSIITEQGLVWAITTYSEYPTVSDNKLLGSLGGSFSLNITGLQPGTDYSLRSYAMNNIGLGYGNRREFHTCTLKSMINTLEAINISWNKATIRGEVTCIGNNTPQRYFEWGTTIDYGEVAQVGTGGAGIFSVTLDDLSVNQTYYFRACGQNSSGVYCGSQKTFTAHYNPPTVTTADITNKSFDSADSGGSVTDDGGLSVTARGVCWNIFGDPTTEDTCTSDGTGLGDFVSHLTNLETGLTYYVRAYATNDIGIGYGVVKSFKTLGYCKGIAAGGDPGGTPLTCSLRQVPCLEGETLLLRLYRSTNSHAEMPDQTFYNYFVCCRGNDLGASCEGNYDTFLKLAKATNSHVQKKDQQNYPFSACLSTSYGAETDYPSTIACSYITSPSTCDDLGELYTCLASIAKDSSSHAAECGVYPIQVCCANICP